MKAPLIIACFAGAALATSSQIVLTKRGMFRASDARLDHDPKPTSPAPPQPAPPAPVSRPARPGIGVIKAPPRGPPGRSIESLLMDRQITGNSADLQKAVIRAEWDARNPPPRVQRQGRNANWIATNTRFDELQRQANTVEMVRNQTEEDPILSMEHPWRENSRTYMSPELSRIMKADRDRRPTT